MADTRTIFQSLLTPDSTGKLPAAEGVVSFQQTLNAAGASNTVGGKPLIPADGYFFVMLAFYQVSTGGGTTGAFLFPVGYPNAAQTQVFKPGVNHIGLAISFSTVAQPVPPGFQIIPFWYNGTAVNQGVFTIYGIQLKDCPDNWKAFNN